MKLSAPTLLTLAAGIGKFLKASRRNRSQHGWSFDLAVAREFVAQAPPDLRRAMCRMIRVGMWGQETAKAGGAR